LRGSDLRNLSNQEVLGQLLFTRSAFWSMSPENSKSRSWIDLSRAFYLAPDDIAIQKAYHSIFTHYGITATDTLATLQEKERNLMQLPLSGPASREAMSRWQQLPPTATQQAQLASPVVSATITAQQSRKTSTPTAANRKEPE
jgi:hypothetical protein